VILVCSLVRAFLFVLAVFCAARALKKIMRVAGRRCMDSEEVTELMQHK